MNDSAAPAGCTNRWKTSHLTASRAAPRATRALSLRAPGARAARCVRAVLAPCGRHASRPWPLARGCLHPCRRQRRLLGGPPRPRVPSPLSASAACGSTRCRAFCPWTNWHTRHRRLGRRRLGFRCILMGPYFANDLVSFRNEH